MDLKKTIALLFIIFFSFFSEIGVIFAQDASPTPAPQSVQDLQNKINDLQNKINDLQGQEQTLSSQISVMDNQISLTELKINATKQQITDLTLNIDTANKKISNIEQSINNLTKVLVNRIIATYEIGTAPSAQILLASSNVSDFVNRHSTPAPPHLFQYPPYELLL